MKRIGVVIPAITDNLQSELLDGIFKCAAAADCDVIVFTTATNGLDFHIQSEIMEGEEQIYSLLERVRLDGVLFASQYFIKETVRSMISERIRAAGIPCVDLGGTALGYETVSIPQDEAICTVTDHVIARHHCRRLLFLAGYQENADSQQRLSGFLRAVKAHSCEYEIEYGDFWKGSAIRLGNAILQHERPMPDAIICASDMMAVHLCDTLQKGGLAVPEDIIVTGYDGHLSALSHFPSITTVSGGMRELGRRGAEKLLAQIGISPVPHTDDGLHILYGGSCGCVERMKGYEEAALLVQEFIRDEAEANEMFEMRINSDFITRASSVESLTELVALIDQTAHNLKNFRSMHWCLYPDWDGEPEHPDLIRKSAYPKQMLCILSKSAWQDGVQYGLFPTADCVPMLAKPHPPTLLYLLSLHASAQVFGYCGFAYENAADFTISILLFNLMSAAANGLRMLRHKRYAEYLQRKIEEASLYDKMTDMLSKKGLLQYLEKQEQAGTQNGMMIVTIAKLYANTQESGGGHLSDRVIQSELLLANAIRLLSGRKLQTARLDKQTFAIVFPLAERTAPAQFAEEMMMQLEVMIRKMQEGTAAAFLPEPYYVCGEVTAPAAQCLSALWDALNAHQPKENRFTGVGQFRRLRREIHRAPELNWTLGELSRRLNISKSYVQKLYKEHFGISFKDDLIDARIEMAKRLLQETDLRISEVAASCGYQNATHFMRQFRDKNGVSPSAFRQHDANTD